MKNVLNRSFNVPALKFKPVFLCISMIVGTTTVAQAAIVPTNGAGILNQGNGPTVIYINKPSQGGVSHNTYSQFDVDQKGVILNNSAGTSNTTLGGKIGGNGNVYGGRAKVILNEVNSNTASSLNGMIEVAGGKAQVIVANASGITCNNCGFINTNRVTLTTGTVNTANDGSIVNYATQQGKITVNGGLTTTSPTDLLARSVAINGDVQAQRLNVIAGNNLINAAGERYGTVNGLGAKPTVGIDVSGLGGMYANKISLLATETGVGVSNKGTIGTINGALTIDTAGSLVNTGGSINSATTLDIHSEGLTNTGAIAGNKNVNIVAGNARINNDRGEIISYNNDVNLITSSAISNNDGRIRAQQNLTTLSENIVNDNGTFRATAGDLNVHSTNIVYNRDNLSNQNDPSSGFIAGRDANISAVRIVNENSNITAGRDLSLDVQSSIENTANSHITAQRKANVSTMYLTQNNSQLNSVNGRMDIDASTSLSNDALSKIHSGKLLNIDTNQLNNSGAIISDNGKTVINANTLSNRSGYIKVKNLEINSHSIDNQSGLIRSENALNIKTSQLNNNYSAEFKNVNSRFGLVDQNGGLQTDNGAITVKGDNLYNVYGSIAANVNNQSEARNDVDITLKASLNNNYGKITGVNNQKLNVATLENYAGTVQAGKNLTIDAKSRVNNNYGVLKSNGTTKVKTTILSNGSTGEVSGNRVVIDALVNN